MDSDTLITGIGAAIIILISGYWYMKSNNLQMLPDSIQDELKTVEAEKNSLIEQLDYTSRVLKNISISNAKAIFEKAEELKAGGYTEDELKELGQMVIDKLTQE